MPTLTSKDRLWRTLNGQEVDRVPIWLLFPYHPFSSYVDVYNEPSYREVVAAARAHTDWFDRRGYGTGPFCSASPEIESRRVERWEGDTKVWEDQLVYRDMVLFQQIREGPQGKSRKWLIETLEDLEKALALPYEPPQPDVSAFFREQEELGDDGLMMVNLPTPLSFLYSPARREEYAVWSVTAKPTLLRFLDVMFERVSRFYQYVLEQGLGPTFFLTGSEFAGPPLLAPAQFHDFVVACDRPLIELLQSYGHKVIVHYHGNLQDVLGGMAALGLDGLHTVEAPPIGNCPLARAREALGPEVCLIGNVQYGDLSQGSPEEIDALVREALRDAGERFILSPTAGPYEQRLPERTARNYLQFIESGLKYGRSTART